MQTAQHPVKSAAARKLRKNAKRRASRARKSERKCEALARRQDVRGVCPRLLQQQQPPQQLAAGACQDEVTCRGDITSQLRAPAAEGQIVGPCHGQIEALKEEVKSLSAAGAGVKDVAPSARGGSTSAVDADVETHEGADAEATGRGTVAAAAAAVAATEAVKVSANEKVHDDKAGQAASTAVMAIVRAGAAKAEHPGCVRARSVPVDSEKRAPASEDPANTCNKEEAAKASSDSGVLVPSLPPPPPAARMGTAAGRRNSPPVKSAAFRMTRKRQKRRAARCRKRARKQEVGACEEVPLECSDHLDHVSPNGLANAKSVDDGHGASQAEEKVGVKDTKTSHRKPAAAPATRSATRRAFAKLAVERRNKRAARRQAARQKHKEVKVEEKRVRDAEAQHRADAAEIEAAACRWRERRVEVEKIVAAARATQEALHRLTRRRSAAIIQATWRRAVARSRCIRQYVLCIAHINRQAAADRAQRQHRQQRQQREAAAAGLVQAAWRRPAVRARCSRAYALRVGGRRRREKALQVIASACYAYAEAKRTSDKAELQGLNVEESLRAAAGLQPGKHEETHEASAGVQVEKGDTGGAAATAHPGGAAGEQGTGEAITLGEEARAARRRASFVLPPARQHTFPVANTAPGTSIPSAASTSAQMTFLVTYPLQLVQGKTLLYDPTEFGLWDVMSQLQGWTLALGAAPIWAAGNEREAEAFSAACGFSAAWGPTVLEVVAKAVYGEPFSRGVTVLPLEHVLYAFGTYWEREISPYDTVERFCRLLLLKAGSEATTAAADLSRGIRKVCDKKTAL